MTWLVNESGLRFNMDSTAISTGTFRAIPTRKEFGGLVAPCSDVGLQHCLVVLQADKPLPVPVAPGPTRLTLNFELWPIKAIPET